MRLVGNRYVNLTDICPRCIIDKQINALIHKAHLINERLIKWLCSNWSSRNLLIALEQRVVVFISVGVLGLGRGRAETDQPDFGRDIPLFELLDSSRDKVAFARVAIANYRNDDILIDVFDIIWKSFFAIRATSQFPRHHVCLAFQSSGPDPCPQAFQRVFWSLFDNRSCGFRIHFQVAQAIFFRAERANDFAETVKHHRLLSPARYQCLCTLTFSDLMIILFFGEAAGSSLFTDFPFGIETLHPGRNNRRRFLSLARSRPSRTRLEAAVCSPGWQSRLAGRPPYSGGRRSKPCSAFRRCRA